MGDAKRDNSDTELTSTMGNVLSTSINEEKSDTGDATPTSSTDASTTSTSSKIVSDDPISSTSSDVVDDKKAATVSASSVPTADDDAKVSSMEQDADLLEMSITEVSTERITEDVEDLVHDLESLLGEPADVYIAPPPKERSSEDKDSPQASVAESEYLLENVDVPTDVVATVTQEDVDTGCDTVEETDEVGVKASQQLQDQHENNDEANEKENVPESEETSEEQTPNDSEAESTQTVESAPTVQDVQMEEDTTVEEAITQKESQVDSSEDGTETVVIEAGVVELETDKDCASSSNEANEIPSKSDVGETEDTVETVDSEMNKMESGDAIEADLELPVEETKEVDQPEELTEDVDMDKQQSDTVGSAIEEPQETIVEAVIEETDQVSDDKPEEIEASDDNPSDPNEPSQNDIPQVEDDGIVPEVMEADQNVEVSVESAAEGVAESDRSLDDPERTQTASLSLENLEDSTAKSQEDVEELPLEDSRSESKTEEEIQEAELVDKAESGEQHNEQKEDTEAIPIESMDTEETTVSELPTGDSEEPNLVSDVVDQAPGVRETEISPEGHSRETESEVDLPETDVVAQEEEVNTGKGEGFNTDEAEAVNTEEPEGVNTEETEEANTGEVEIPKTQEHEMVDDASKDDQPETTELSEEQVAVDQSKVAEGEDTSASPKFDLEVVPQKTNPEHSDDSATVVEEPEQEINEQTQQSVVDSGTEDSPPKLVEEMEISDDLPESSTEPVEAEERATDDQKAEDEVPVRDEDIADPESTETYEPEAGEQTIDTAVEIKDTEEELNQTESPAEIQDVAAAEEEDSKEVESHEQGDTQEEPASGEIKCPDQEVEPEEPATDETNKEVDAVDESSEVMTVEEMDEDNPLQLAPEDAKETVETSDSVEDVEEKGVQSETSVEKSGPEIDNEEVATIEQATPTEEDSKEMSQPESCDDLPETVEEAKTEEEGAKREEGEESKMEEEPKTEDEETKMEEEPITEEDKETKMEEEPKTEEDETKMEEEAENEEAEVTTAIEAEDLAQGSVSDSPEKKTEEAVENTEKESAGTVEAEVLEEQGEETSPEVDPQSESVANEEQRESEEAVADEEQMESDGVILEEVETEAVVKETEAESENEDSLEKYEEPEPSVGISVPDSVTMDQTEVEEATETVQEDSVQLETGNSEEVNQSVVETDEESAVASEVVETVAAEESDGLTTVADIVQEEEVDSTVDDVLRDVIGDGEQAIEAANDLDELEDAITGIQTDSGVLDKDDEVPSEDQAEFVKTVDDNLIEIVKIVNSKPTEIIKTVEEYQAEVVKTVDDELTETINSVASSKEDKVEDEKLAEIVKTVDDEISSLVVELDEDEDELVPILALDTEEDTANNAEEIPPSLMETTESDEVLEAVANLNEINTEAADTGPVLSEKERLEMEALRKAVESITGEPEASFATIDDVIEDVDKAADVLEDVQQPEMKSVVDVEMDAVVEPSVKDGDEQSEKAVVEEVKPEELANIEEPEVGEDKGKSETELETEVASEKEVAESTVEQTIDVQESEPEKVEESKEADAKVDDVDSVVEEVDTKLEAVSSKPEETDSASEKSAKPALKKSEDSSEVEVKVKSVPKVEEVGVTAADSAQEAAVENNLSHQETVVAKSGPRVGRPRKELSSVKNSLPGKEETPMRTRTRRSASRNKKSQKTDETPSNSVAEEAKQNVEEEEKMHLPDSSVEVAVAHMEKDVKSKASDRPKRHKKAAPEKLEELSINVDVPDKEKPYSPKITIKPIKTPEEEVSTTSNSDSENQKGSLKITITKQSDKMHSILKVCDSENSESVNEEEAEPVPKLKIKNIGSSVDQMGAKMSTRSSKHLYSPTSSSQRASSPRITIKIGGLKAEEKTSPKMLAESSVSPKKVIIKPVVKPASEDAEQPQVHSPRITIKPIPKPEADKETSTPVKVSARNAKKNDEEAAEPDKGRSSPKVTIKPLVKPASPETQAEGGGEEEVKERIVLKINKGNLATPTKENKKRELSGDDEKSDNWARITVKFSKEGGHPHIVQQNDDSHKRPSEEASPEKTKKQKVSDGESSSIATRTRHKDTAALETSDSHASKHKETTSECPVESKKPKLSMDEVCTTDDDVRVVESKPESPIVISEDSRSQDSCVIVEESKQQSPMPRPMALQDGNGNAKASPLPSPAGPKKRGRPRKVPLVVREDFKEVEEPPTPEPPVVELSSPVHESGRPKRSCRGQSARDALGIKPRKPRGGGRGRGSKRGMGSRPETDRVPVTSTTTGPLTFEPMQTDAPPSEEKAKTLLGQPISDTALITIEEVVARARSSEPEREPEPEPEPFEKIECENVEAVVEEVKETGKEVISDDSSVTVPPQPIGESSDSQILLSHDVSSTSISSEVVMVDEDTRMSAETNSRSQTPAKQMVAPVEAVIEESQSSMQSSATTESGKAPSSKSTKGTRLEVTEPDAGVINAEQLSEYYWNGNGPFMLQEQVAQYLGIKSFKRKYPNIKRRTVDMQERDHIKERGLASEHMCDLGLTAVNSADILDIMYSDFQDKYEEYCKHQRDRQAKELINKQRALSLAVSQEKSKADMTEQAVQSAMQWNAMFNKTRREQRKACMDLQTYTIHYPKGRKKDNSKGKVGNYPVALVPGQFMDYYAEYTPTEINNLPLNTMLYEPINIDNTIHESEDDGSDGSSSDSDSSSSSSGSDSDSSSGIEDCKLCKHSSGSGKKIAATK